MCICLCVPAIDSHLHRKQTTFGRVDLSTCIYTYIYIELATN